jgi:hypothetical protein
MISLRKVNDFAFLSEVTFGLEFGLRNQVDSKDVN